MKGTWKVEIAAGAKTQAEVKIQRSIFNGDIFLSVLFVIAMISFNYIFRKCTR